MKPWALGARWRRRSAGLRPLRGKPPASAAALFCQLKCAARCKPRRSMRARSSESSNRSAMARDDFIHGIRVEQNRRAIHYFRHGRGIGADHGAAARHGFERRQSEAFVERGEGEHVARVIKLQAGRYRRRIRKTGCGRPRPIRGRHRERGWRTMFPCRPAPDDVSTADSARTNLANAWIRPIWFLRGCRSPTERTKGSGIFNRSRT